MLLKDFKTWAKGLTASLRDSTVRLAEEQELKVHYVPSSSTRKEDLARQLSADRSDQDGLSCRLAKLPVI